MQRSPAVTLAFFLLAFIAAEGLVAAQPLTTKVEVRCDDDTLAYQITSYALSVVKGSTTHVVTNDATAARRVRLAIARVLNDDVTIGIALAILVTRSTAQGQIEVMHFSNQIVPLSDLEATVRRELLGVLR